MRAWAYYNEFDPYAAAWLRNLIDAGLIAQGEVDERSILEVRADDLKEFTQCHFFAGIGGWSRALRLAGWSDERPIWSGSCPCQPLSSAGQRQGDLDERHIWPAFFNLIAERRPSVVVGEQVASADGREWLAAVRLDMESVGYALGAADLPAACVGAPHIRQRLFFVAHALQSGRPEGRPVSRIGSVAGGSGAGLLADATSSGSFPGAHGRLHRGEEGRGPRDAEPERHGSVGVMDHPGGERRDGGQVAGHRGLDYWTGAGRPQGEHGAERAGESGPGVALGDASIEGLSAREREAIFGAWGREPGRATEQSGGSFWADAEYLPCSDGKARPAKPSIQPLAYGLSGRVAVACPYEQTETSIQERWVSRVGPLKGAGNAIVPQVAAKFVEAFMEYKP